MRTVDKTLQVSENILVEKEVKNETVVSFTVDLENKFIIVYLNLLDGEGEIISKENYTLENELFKKFPSETDLWIAIDKLRSLEESWTKLSVNWKRMK